MRAQVADGKITFPAGSRYSVLVLPEVETMTPETLAVITRLVHSGATVVGKPPRKSPSLVGFPECDRQLRELAEQLWGAQPQPVRKFGKGSVILSPNDQPAAPPERTLPEAAGWIWFNKGDPAHDAAAGDVHFRMTFEIADIREMQSAFVEATADNSFTLEVNGRKMLNGDNFNHIQRADVLSALRSGGNTVRAIANNGESPTRNPAGFIAAVRLNHKGGAARVIATGPEWQASLDGRAWSAAKLLGAGTMAPWRLKGSGPSEKKKLYPAYDFLAALLAEKGISEDFRSDAPIRYAHRRSAAAEIYFVANTTDKKVKTSCTFRVEKGAPQLWDPVTAETRALPEFVHQNRTTSLSLDFDAHQSFFVIFPRSDSSKELAPIGRANFAKLQPALTLDGAWELAFDPKWGGPASVVFNTLQDWTQSMEPGIKYYSGSATYRQTFDAPGIAESGICLDLGTVHDMARVRLNGTELGIVWCAPWQVEISGHLKPKGNILEIEVVNRWPNRLAGDQQPPDKDLRTLKWESGLLGGKEFKTGRYTFTTGAAPRQLLPSGLLGPVVLRSLTENPVQIPAR
jgi:hypothetical protein